MDPALIVIIAAPFLWLGAAFIGADAIAYYFPRIVFLGVIAWVAASIVIGWVT